jgi:hypothetical protein
MNGASGAGASTSGGTDGESGGESGAAALARAIAQLAFSECDKLGSCGSAYRDYLFGDADGCLTRMASVYLWVATLPATGFTTEALLACARARSRQSCDGYFSYFSPPECVVSGSAPLGAACVSGAQCASGFCPADYTCAACASAPAAGAPCTGNSECPEGMLCSDAKKCARPAALGMPCGPEQPCDNWLLCSGTCQRYAATVGSGCASQVCDFRLGLLCNTSTLQCMTSSGSDSGEPCGAVGETSVRICTAQGVCNEGTCRAAPGLGAACSDATPCVYPEACIDGRCTGLPSAESCEP